MSSASRESGTRRRMKLRSRDCSRVTTSEIRRSCSDSCAPGSPHPSSKDVDELRGYEYCRGWQKRGELRVWLAGCPGQLILEQSIDHHIAGNDDKSHGSGQVRAGGNLAPSRVMHPGILVILGQIDHFTKGGSPIPCVQFCTDNALRLGYYLSSTTPLRSTSLAVAGERQDFCKGGAPCPARISAKYQHPSCSRCFSCLVLRDRR